MVTVTARAEVDIGSFPDDDIVEEYRIRGLGPVGVDDIVSLADLETAIWRAERGELSEAIVQLVHAIPRFHNLLKLVKA